MMTMPSFAVSTAGLGGIAAALFNAALANLSTTAGTPFTSERACDTIARP